MLKYVLLGSLNYLPMTGYELKQFMDRSTANFWHAKLSQIYTTLKSLEGEGLVASTTVYQETRPDRRVYAITDAGRSDLDAWLKDVNMEPGQSKEPLLVKLFFSARVDKATLLAELRLQRELHEKALENLRGETREGIAQTVVRAPHLRKDALLWEATRRSGELLEAAALQWFDETIAMVEKEF